MPRHTSDDDEGEIGDYVYDSDEDNSSDDEEDESNNETESISSVEFEINLGDEDESENESEDESEEADEEDGELITEEEKANITDEEEEELIESEDEMPPAPDDEEADVAVKKSTKEFQPTGTLKPLKKKIPEPVLGTVTLNVDDPVREEIDEKNTSPKPPKPITKAKNVKIFPFRPITDPIAYLYNYSNDITKEDFEKKYEKVPVMEIQKECILLYLEITLIEPNFDKLAKVNANFNSDLARKNLDSLPRMIFNKLWYNCGYEKNLEQKVLQPIIDNLF